LSFGPACWVDCRLKAKEIEENDGVKADKWAVIAYRPLIWAGAPPSPIGRFVKAYGNFGLPTTRQFVWVYENDDATGARRLGIGFVPTGRARQSSSKLPEEPPPRQFGPLEQDEDSQ